MKTSETNSENKFTSENKFLILLSTEVAEDVNIPDYVLDITEKSNHKCNIWILGQFWREYKTNV